MELRLERYQALTARFACLVERVLYDKIGRLPESRCERCAIVNFESKTFLSTLIVLGKIVVAVAVKFVVRYGSACTTRSRSSWSVRVQGERHVRWYHSRRCGACVQLRQQKMRLGRGGRGDPTREGRVARGDRRRVSEGRRTRLEMWVRRQDPGHCKR